jgi:KaiC/GvpD/RAD55 family RecA-like ATPase
MVVLGEAGAGKTVLAVRFLLDQLHHRATLADAGRGRTSAAPSWMVEMRAKRALQRSTRIFISRPARRSS